MFSTMLSVFMFLCIQNSVWNYKETKPTHAFLPTFLIPVNSFWLQLIQLLSFRPFILEKSGLYIFDVPKRRCLNQILKFFRTFLSDTISVPISFWRIKWKKDYTQDFMLLRNICINIFILWPTIERNSMTFYIIAWRHVATHRYEQNWMNQKLCDQYYHN